MDTTSLFFDIHINTIKESVNINRMDRVIINGGAGRERRGGGKGERGRRGMVVTHWSTIQKE